MNDTMDLNPIIRKLSGQTPVVADEEVLVTIDLASKKAIEKTFRVRIAGNFQDYLVANNQDPTRTSSGKLSTYYVCDARNERTLALEISFVAYCPKGHEVKVTEALHGEQSPAHTFAALLERWVREFIPLGDESRFIDNYDVARHQMEKHLAHRASAQTGLELLPKVAISGEHAVRRELVVGPVEINVRLHDYEKEQKITVEAGLALDSQNYVKAFVYQEKQDSPEELFKNRLREYFFQQVTFQQFSRELQSPGFKQPLQQSLSAALRQVGRRLSFINFSTSEGFTITPPSEFVAVTYDCSHQIYGRSQPVVIQNTVQLYCESSVAFIASGITDLEAWVKNTLNVALKRHLIGKTYVDLLLRFDPLEQAIKREMSARAALIGYKVDHLVSIPNLKETGLTTSFLLETEDTFETALDDFKVQLKFSLKLCIPNLQSIEKYLNPGTDVKEAITEVIISEARQCLRNIHPERFYLYFNRPNETSTPTGDIDAHSPDRDLLVKKSAELKEEERLSVKDLLVKRISESLRGEFSAEISDLTLRVGRTDLTERYNNLCFVIREFRVSLESSTPHGAEPPTLTGNFELRGVYSDSEGWQRFSALQLDLDGLQAQLECHLKAELKSYYQLGLIFQNRTGRRQVFDLVKDFATLYMRREFGLIIHLTNLDRSITEDEAREHQQYLCLKIEIEKNIEGLRRKRVKVLSFFPIDNDTLKEIDESIRLLQDEVETLAALRFGPTRLAATSEKQYPDELPGTDQAAQIAIQYESDSRPQSQLTD